MILASSPAWADDEKGRPPLIVPHCLPHGHDCRPGVWFALPEAKRLLKQDNRRLELAAKVSWLERINTSRGRQIAALDDVIHGQRTAIREAQVRWQAERRRADRLEGRFSNLLSNPHVWFAAGVLLGGGTTIYLTTR